ncbi:MAG: hypothetical protein JF589_02100 [Gemmatimonadetes bacterium]|nr:hypothetical protein [Gemmatimonadota bacterium]
MPKRAHLIPAVLAIIASLCLGRPAHAQHEGHAGMAVDSGKPARVPNSLHVMAQAIPVVTHAQNTAAGRDLTEGYLAQWVAMGGGRLLQGHLVFDVTLNGEGLTLRRGELSTGAFGEGYIDRRHPHTYLHELIATGVGSAGPLAYSGSVGRGFVPYGTDDPMMRPFEKYPINHHLSQILERGLVIGALRLGPAILEASSFGGDEPTSPGALPRRDRLGDSWSVRSTVLPFPGAELQASYASVRSPEQPAGFGLDQRKQSISGRYVSATGRRYLLAEWARTDERDRDRDLAVFGYETALLEGAATVGPVDLGLRLEQTERPEEERLANPFRTPRPATDLSIAGITRWRAATAAVAFPGATLGPLRGYPYVELERLAASPRSSTDIFDARQFYGSPIWMASFGVRIRYGVMHPRMGRYGVALPAGPTLHMLGVDPAQSTTHVGH